MESLKIEPDNMEKWGRLRRLPLGGVEWISTPQPGLEGGQETDCQEVLNQQNIPIAKKRNRIRSVLENDS